MRDAAIPIELAAARAFERGNDGGRARDGRRRNDSTRCNFRAAPSSSPRPRNAASRATLSSASGYRATTLRYLPELRRERDASARARSGETMRRKTKPAHTSTPTRCSRRDSGGTSSARDERRRDERVRRARTPMRDRDSEWRRAAIPSPQSSRLPRWRQKLRWACRPSAPRTTIDALAGHVDHAIRAARRRARRCARRRTTGPRRSPRCSRAIELRAPIGFTRKRRPRAAEIFRRFHR